MTRECQHNDVFILPVVSPAVPEGLARLRESDAAYAAVALRFGTQLVTLDKEQLKRLPKVLPVKTSSS
jgi:predicted nucleic acid-binding protein